MKRLPVQPNSHALLDDEDYDRLRHHSYRLDRNGYALRSEKGRTIYLHADVCPALPGLYVDHRNGKPLDCRRQNLRPANSAQNQANRRKVQGRIPIKGVTYHPGVGKFQAQIKVRGRSIYLGLFACPVAAGWAYLRAAREHFGDFHYSNIFDRKAREAARNVAALLRSERGSETEALAA